jgi:hypothetical protein
MMCGGGGKDFFCRTHPGVCHRHHDGDNVKVIHRTVVVHDRDNNQQTIIVNANTAGTCQNGQFSSFWFEDTNIT